MVRRLVRLALESINLLCQTRAVALALWYYFQCLSELYPCIRSHAHAHIQCSCCDAWEELPYCGEAGNQLAVWWYCTLAGILNDQDCPALSGNHGVLLLSPVRSLCCAALVEILTGSWSVKLLWSTLRAISHFAFLSYILFFLFYYLLPCYIPWA